MDRAGLLKSIAETGYNVGFGAKKHFATFDIVEKAPGWIGFASIAFGVYGLLYESLSAKLPSATLTLLGVCALYISLYESAEYDATGRKITEIFNELRDLSRAVEVGADIEGSHAKLRSLESSFYRIAITKQILFSDWLAHYKFFAKQQIGWIDTQLHFTWKDRIPLSMRISAGIVLVGAICLGIHFTNFKPAERRGCAGLPSFRTSSFK